LTPHASISWLIKASEEVLDLRQHLLVLHRLGGLVDVHHHGPLEVCPGAGYRVHAVIMSVRSAAAGDVGELVEGGVVAVLAGRVLAEEALVDHHAVPSAHRLRCVDDSGLFLTLGPFALQGRRRALLGRAELLMPAEIRLTKGQLQ
jgi:hypothetical protein